jgi:tryptophan-rich sensory protein
MFFGAHWTGFGLFIILTLLGVSVSFMTRAKDRVASLCFAPYIAWLLYASALILAIVVLN